MKSLKKLTALVAVAALAVTPLAGCQKQKDIDNSEIVMTVGDKKVELGLANFFVRYQQSMIEEQMEMYQQYGYAMDWDTEVEDGTTYEESVKQSVLDSLKTLYVLDAHTEEYEVALTDDENTAIENAAKAFTEANSDEVSEKVSGEYAKEYMRLVTIGNKMKEAIKASHTPEVTDEEANQKIMYYVKYDLTETDDSGNTTELTEDEIAELKKDAQAFLEGAKSNGNLEAYATEQEVTATKAAFNADNEALEEKLVEAADALELNGFTDVIEGESALYVAQVTSLSDEEATNEKREELIEEKKDEYYEETVEKWTEDTESKIYDKVWDKVSLEGLKITSIEPEEDDDSDSSTDTTTEE